MIGLFDNDDTMELGVSDWKHGGPLGELLFSDDKELCDSFNRIVQTPEGRMLNRKAWLREAFNAIGRGHTDELIESYAVQFGELVESEMTKFTTLDPEVKSTLEYLQDRSVPCYVISGASHANVNALLRLRDTRHLFDGVYGFGWSKGESGQGLGKSEAVADILKHRSLSEFPPGSFVVGDGDSDLRLAREFDLMFYAVPTSWNGWHDKPPVYEKLHILSSFGELQQLIQ